MGGRAPRPNRLKTAQDRPKTAQDDPITAQSRPKTPKTPQGVLGTPKILGRGEVTERAPEA